MKVAVIGTGQFGYAIAYALNKNNNEIIMWGEDENKTKLLQQGKLELVPGFKVVEGITFTNSFEEALKDTKIVFVVVPSQFMASVCKGMAPYVRKDMYFCIDSKGVEKGTSKFVHQIFEDYIDSKHYSTLSGPAFAVDILKDEPCGFSLGSKSYKTTQMVKAALASNSFKLRASRNVIGVELCGTLKNVIAIASGMLEGLGYSDTARSFLIVESMHDIKELISAFGANKKTIQSYAGIGDLILTCTSTKSRNYSYGVLLGKKDFDGAKAYLENNTVEGYNTLKTIHSLLRKKRIKMPIINLIYEIVVNEKDPESLVKFLINKD